MPGQSESAEEVYSVAEFICSRHISAIQFENICPSTELVLENR
jgi:hypothetical protein